MAETRMEGSRGGQINFDIKNSGDLLMNLFGLLDVDVSTNTNTIPIPTILFNGPLKPGLSKIEIASAIINRQSQAIAQQNNIFPQGGIAEAMEFIRIDEIVKAIQTQMRVDIVTLPSANAGGPIPIIPGYGQGY